MQSISYELISKLPKVELHCHLDGSLRTRSILEQAEKDISKFVVSSNQALIWDTLRSVNINSNIKGYGKIFEL